MSIMHYVLLYLCTLSREGPPTLVGMKKKLVLIDLNLLCIEPGGSYAILVWVKNVEQQLTNLN